MQGSSGWFFAYCSSTTNLACSTNSIERFEDIFISPVKNLEEPMELVTKPECYFISARAAHKQLLRTDMQTVN
jgi:hypothetical protein